jgi:hypothetical protein
MYVKGARNTKYVNLGIFGALTQYLKYSALKCFKRILQQMIFGRKKVLS